MPPAGRSALKVAAADEVMEDVLLLLPVLVVVVPLLVFEAVAVLEFVAPNNVIPWLDELAAAPAAVEAEGLVSL